MSAAAQNVIIRGDLLVFDAKQAHEWRPCIVTLTAESILTCMLTDGGADSALRTLQLGKSARGCRRRQGGPEE